MHNYVSKNEMIGLVTKDRKAVIICNITTKDIDEYINNVIIFLENNKFSRAKLTIPKIIKEQDGTYSLMLLIRSGIEAIESERLHHNLYKICKLISNDTYVLPVYIQRKHGMA